MGNRPLACALTAALLVAAAPGGAHAENVETFFRDALGAFAGKSRLPFDFYGDIPASDYLSVEWRPDVASGTFTENTLTGSKWVKLNPSLSVDGRGGGGIKPIEKMSASNAATLFHEGLHAYMNWARVEAQKGALGNVRARQLADLQRSTQCRYREVVLEGATAATALTEKQQWQMVEESWTTWLAALANEWVFAAQQVKLGNLSEAEVEERVVAKLADLAKNGPSTRPYYNASDGSTVHAANKRMSVREMKFLMANLLHLDRALIDRALAGVKDPQAMDEDAANLCVDRSVVYVLDASGSMREEGKIDAAKRAVEGSIDALSAPPTGSVEWALMVYGPRGCGGAAVVAPFTTDPELVKQALGTVAPSGSTPLARSTTDAAAYMASDARGRKHRNLVVLTDGGESCQGDPVAAAKSVRKIQTSLPLPGGARP